MRAIFACALLMAIAGCSAESAEERAASLAAADDAQCRAKGAVPETDAYAKCRADLAKRRSDAERAKSDSLMAPKCKTSSVAGQMVTFCQ